MKLYLHDDLILWTTMYYLTNVSQFPQPRLEVQSNKDTNHSENLLPTKFVLIMNIENTWIL